MFDEGWNDVNSGIETKSIESTIRTTKEERLNYLDLNSVTDIAKERLIELLMEQIQESKYILFTKTEIPDYQETIEFKAKMFCADYAFGNTVVDTKLFYYKGLTWTDEQIKEALLNHFTEEML